MKRLTQFSVVICFGLVAACGKNEGHVADAGSDAGFIPDRIQRMTEGGPVGQTEVMVYKIYFDGFKGLDYSGAAAQSIVLMLLVISLTFIQFKWVERRIHYS